MNLSWDKLSNRCLRAMFSMPNIRFCWSRNSSSAETSYPSACKVILADSVKSCTIVNKQFLFEHFSFWRPCLQNLDISFHFSYILKFPESGPLGKLPAFCRTKDFNFIFFRIQSGSTQIAIFYKTIEKLCWSLNKNWSVTVIQLIIGHGKAENIKINCCILLSRGKVSRRIEGFEGVEGLERFYD